MSNSKKKKQALNEAKNFIKDLEFSNNIVQTDNTLGKQIDVAYQINNKKKTKSFPYGTSSYSSNFEQIYDDNTQSKDYHYNSNVWISSQGKKHYQKPYSIV
jgi:hypothetical protein